MRTGSSIFFRENRSEEVSFEIALKNQRGSADWCRGGPHDDAHFLGPY